MCMFPSPSGDASQSAIKTPSGKEQEDSKAVRLGGATYKGEEPGADNVLEKYH